MRNFAITCVEEIYVKELSNLSAESFSISTGDDVMGEDLKSTPNLEMRFEMHRKMYHIFGQCFTAFQQPRNRSHKIHTQSKPHLMLIKSLLITPKNNYPKRLF